MFNQERPFRPGSTITIAASTTATTAVPLPIGSAPSWQVMVQNTGSNLAFCKFGASPVTATTGDFPLAPGAILVLTMDGDQKYVSAITAASTTTVYITGGTGG